MTNQPESRPETERLTELQRLHAIATERLRLQDAKLQTERSVLGARLRDVEAERDHLAGLLSVLRWDLHTAYANTARRGRGIGGQQVTTQCSVLDPDVWETRALNAVDEALGRRADDQAGRPLGDVIAELRVAFIDPVRPANDRGER